MFIYAPPALRGRASWPHASLPSCCGAARWCATGQRPAALVPEAYAEDQVSETALTVAGTPEPDGRPVRLDVTILTTDPATPRPAVVLAHGFGGTKDDSLEPARTLAQDGYTVIIYTARGFGASGGSDPSRPSRTTRAPTRVKIIDLAGDRDPRWLTDRRTIPVIGFAGASYGGAVSLMAAGLDPRVDAIVPGVHLEPAEPGPVPAVPGGGGAPSHWPT